MAEIITSHRLYYSNKQPIPIRDVVDSLLALEDLIQQTPPVLEALFPGTSIAKVEVLLNEVQSGSLWEDVGVKFFFGSQKKMDQFIKTAREKVGMDTLMSNPQLFSAVLLVLILSGGAYYLGKEPNKQEQRATIEANNNVIINIGAGMVEMTPENFRTLIEAAVPEKARLSKNAVRIVKPAKRDTEARIELDENSGLTISPDSVRAMPSFVTEPEPDEEMEELDELEITVRATDLDSNKRGWAAVLPSIHPTRRVRLQLDPTVDPAHVMLHPNLVGNATVVFRRNEEGERIPTLVFLREVTSPPQEKK